MLKVCTVPNLTAGVWVDQPVQAVCWCTMPARGTRGHRADVDGAGRPARRAGCGRCGLPLRCAATALLREPSRCRLRAAGPRKLRGAVRLADDALLRVETIAKKVSFDRAIGTQQQRQVRVAALYYRWLTRHLSHQEKGLSTCAAESRAIHHRCATSDP